MSCPACFTGTAHAGEPTGLETKLGDLPAYHAPAVGRVKGVLLFLTDVFGHKLNNTRLLADTYGAAGFDVFVPDILQGAPVPTATISFMDDDTPGFSAAVSRGFQMLRAVPAFVSFFWGHSEASTLPIVEAAARSARAKADEKGVQLGGVGFCFGGRFAVKLAGGVAPLVDVAVACHPSGLGSADINAVNRPLLFCTPEKDPMMNGPAAAKAVEAINSTAGVDGLASFVLYEGMSHGFAVRGAASTEHARAKCAQDVVTFFTQKLACSGTN